MGEKRMVTLVSLSIVLDGTFSKEEFERDFLANIRQTCFTPDMKYAPEVWLDSCETKEMEIIPK